MKHNGEALKRCRQLQRQRDKAKTIEGRRYWAMLLDTAVEDLMTINRWHRKAAKKRLKRMRAA